MKTFNFSPKGDIKRNVHYLDRTIEFESGSFQVQKVGVKPIVTFEMTFEGTSKSLKPLEDFYFEHRKSERFLFDYFGTQYTCQFTGDYAPNDTIGWDRNGKVIGRVSVTLTLRVVNI